jgi:1,4-dihydroxy-6-naphthoate synthase
MKNSRISLGFSPCPNDIYIFAGILHRHVNTRGLEFDIQIADVEELNRKAVLGELDVSKLSFATYKSLINSYRLLDSGAALGFGCGPLLVAAKPIETLRLSVDTKVAIPGAMTTASFLLNRFYPNLKNREEMLFSDIEQALLSGKVELGLLIHENRFTYQEKGLFLVEDLGVRWEQDTQLPIPLGGIFTNKSRIDEALHLELDAILKESLAFAKENETLILKYAEKYAQEINEQVMLQHIRLYVNQYTFSLGSLGHQAVGHLLQT